MKPSRYGWNTKRPNKPTVTGVSGYGFYRNMAHLLSYLILALFTNNNSNFKLTRII